MKKALILACLTLVFRHASAALPFYDPFTDQTGSDGSSYSIGSGLANQTNAGSIYQLINSAAGAPQPTIIAGNLSSTILPQSSGNSVLIVPAAAEGERMNFFATNASGRIYYSFLINVTNIDAVPETADNNWFSGFGDGTGGQTSPLLRIGAKILTLKSGGGYKFGVGKNTTAATFIYENTVHNLGETVFVVAAYEQLPGTATNALLWVNPDPNSFGTISAPTPTLTISTPGTGPQGVLSSSVKSFILACQNATAPTAIIDELRIGTNWSDVTPLGDPAILQNPVSQIASPGTNISFSVTATGTPTLHYQWIKNGTNLLANSGNISGADAATLHISNISIGDVGAYSVVVTNNSGNFVQSSSANLTLSDPAITGQPQSATNNYGTTATFTVIASGTAPFFYQWHKEGVGDLSDGGNISGSQTATLTLTNVSLSEAGNYSVTVSNSAGVADSATASLTVKDPAIIAQPVSVTNTPGATVTFHVTAVGSGTLGYQWQKNTIGNYIFDVGNYSGTSTDTLTISNLSSADEADYSVAVIGANSTVINSDSAHLTVLSPVTITVQPVSRTVAEGAKVAFTVVASGATPLTYQWYLDGTNILGANSPSYVLTNASLSASGNYTVIVSNSVAPATSDPAILTVSTNLQLFETNLVVVRVGDSAQTLTPNGNSIFLDQFDINGNYVNTMNIPDDGTSGMVAIGWDNISGVNSGSTTGTSLTRSLDGRFLVVAGYNTNLNYGADLSVSSSTNVPRGVGLINSHAQYTMPVADTNSVFDKTFWRAALTDGTNNFWGVGGISGTYYFGFNAPPVLVQNTFVNCRSMGLFNGDIYCLTAASFTGQTAKGGLLKMSGMPTNAVTPTIVLGAADGASSGGYDMAVSPNTNVIYVADQRNTLNGGGIQRYDFNGSAWVLSYTLNTGLGSSFGPRYIAADFSGANPVLYVTGNDQSFDNNHIIKFVDSGAGSSGTIIAAAGINQTFRGIHFGPVASPATVTSPVLSVARVAGNVILSWSGAFTLQASTNVVGTYTNIVGATSPYTNSVTSPAQLFFRLHQ